ncbi:alpha/beta hydrolase [Streptomyces sp. NPDC005318]|uniref:alpha/beta fold hydrolase n=1 Tax=Streptomyces sp. NPDC005318 TaxID=3157031 RepID=UPI0033AD1831
MTARVASLRPDLVRTWAGGNGPISAEYVRHPLAEAWQDPVAGDRSMSELEPETLVHDGVTGVDVPVGAAREMVGRMDNPMKDSILRLYRSARTMGAAWEPALSRVSTPCLVFWGALDPARGIEFGERLGATLRADEIVGLGCNHWTVLQRPAEVATVLEVHGGRHAGRWCPGRRAGGRGERDRCPCRMCVVTPCPTRVATA